jgi:outer membrane protein TolC
MFSFTRKNFREFFCGLFIILGLPGAETLELDPYRILQLVQEKNRDLNIARLRLEKASIELEKARNSFGLNIDFTASTMRADMPSLFLGKRVDERQFSFVGTDLNQPGENSHSELSLQASYPVYSGGLKKITRKMAEIGKRATKAEIDAMTNSLLSVGISLFYRYQLCLKSLETETASLERVNSHLQHIEAKYKGGSVLKTDVLAMQVRREETNSRLMRTRNQAAISRSALLNFLGYELDTELKISDSKWQSPKMPENYSIAVEKALNNRRELEAMQEMIGLSRTAIDKASAGNKWQVSLIGQMKTNDRDFTLSQNRDSWFAGVSVTRNIFDNKLTETARKAADLQHEKTQLEAEKQRREIELDVKTTWENLQSSIGIEAVAVSNLNLARENLELVKRQYEGGAANITTLLNADQAYSDALLNDVSARFSRYMAEAELVRATGACQLCQTLEK